MKTIITGLTGGIGSGKTTMAKYFASLGVPVYIADEEAKKILFAPPAIAEIKAVFGEAVFTGNLPDKSKLATLVFNNTLLLQQLNTIIHPKVQQHFIQWALANSNVPFIIKEAAILFESGSYRDCDKIILVTAPKDIRLQRVMARDNTSADRVLERMGNQWDDDEKRKLSDFIIDNTDIKIAEEQADYIYNQLMNL